MYVYVKEWRQMIYPPLMINDFKGGSHSPLHRLSFFISQVYSVQSFIWLFVMLGGLGTPLPCYFCSIRDSHIIHASQGV